MAVSEIQFWDARSCWGTSQFNIKHFCLVWACCVVVQLLLEQPYMDRSVYWRRVPRARRSQERRHRPSKWTDDLAEFVLFLARCGVGWRGWVTWPTLPLDGIPAPSRWILSEQWRLTCRHFFFFFSPLLDVCVVANNRFLPLTLFRHCFFFVVVLFWGSRCVPCQCFFTLSQKEDVREATSQMIRTCTICHCAFRKGDGLVLLLFHPLGTRAYHHGSLVRVQPFCSLRLCCKGVSACCLCVWTTWLSERQTQSSNTKYISPLLVGFVFLFQISSLPPTPKYIHCSIKWVDKVNKCTRETLFCNLLSFFCSSVGNKKLAISMALAHIDRTKQTSSSLTRFMDVRVIEIESRV